MKPTTNSPADAAASELERHGPATAEHLDPHDAPQPVESFRGDFIIGESPIANPGDGFREYRERRRRQGRA